MANGKNASSTDPATWSTFDEVKAAYEKGGFGGVGFVLTENDPFTCIDIDKIDLKKLPQHAERVAGLSFAEISAGGKGFHVWTEYNHDKTTHYNKNTSLDIEVYDRGRFIAVTGVRFNEMDMVSGETINQYIDTYFTRPVLKTTGERVGNAAEIASDEIIKERMFKSKTGEKIKALFAGEWFTVCNADGERIYHSQSEADQAFCNYLAMYTKNNFNQMDRIFKSSGLYREKWDREDYSENTIYSAIDWVMSISTSDIELSPNTNSPGKDIQMPNSFKVKDNMLYRVVLKEKGGGIEEVEYFCSRHVPLISRSFSNVERSQLYYEITWNDRGRIYREIVPAGDIATRKELLKMADLSLSVHDNNVKYLITYFDLFIMLNDIPRSNMVERLGHVKENFIHPLLKSDIEILPSDIGEKQVMEAFEVSGTSEEWIEHVFKKIEEHPKALLMVLASFTSIILNDLKLGPFIVDLSGVTSKGKTTALRVAASVWGNEYLVSEWNGTAVSFERKAAFLNSFPLMLDDSMKADERQLQRFVYNFSGGRSKGRGSVTGSQKEFTWNNLMLSTGETPLTEYAERAGGAAARILPITGLPFEDVDHEYFTDLYESVDGYYGAVGLEFLQHWKDKRKIMLPFYAEYNRVFQEKSQGNEVVSRIARHYAAIIFTGKLLMDFFDVEIDLGWLMQLFDDINRENKATDKPMQMLEAVLIDLDASRESISGNYEVRHELKAIYKDETLFLLPAYLKAFLKTEQTAIRSEWLRREISIGSMQKGKETDSKLIKHCGKVYRAVPIQPNVVEKLGFDFTETQK